MNNMSTADIVVILGVVFAGLAQLIATWRNGTKLDTNTAATVATAATVNTIQTKAAVIEGHVNSKEAKYVEQILALQRENELLRQMIADKRETAAILAQAVAIERATAVQPSPPVTLGLPVMPATKGTPP